MSKLHVPIIKDLAELPEWKCHKVVRASRIEWIEPRTDSLGHIIRLQCGVVDVDAGWVEQKKAVSGGYFVVYDDGYTSFSPAKAFEEGYAPVVNEGDSCGDKA